MNASGSGDRFSPENLLYDGAAKIVNAEINHLKDWRGREPCVGLALSGGGIRSATYCLGVLQALAYRRALPQVDYLSTVSGGGYIGVSLAYLLHQSNPTAAAKGLKDLPKFDVSRENFPYVSYPMVGISDKDPEASDIANPSLHDVQLRQRETFKGRLERRLRQGANYLAPGNGLSLLSLSGVVLRNLAHSLVVHVALLVVLFELLYSFNSPSLTAPPSPTSALTLPDTNGFLYAASGAIAAYVVLSILFIFSTRLFDRMERKGWRWSYRIRRSYEVAVNYLFLTAFTLLAVGGLPWVYALLDTLQLTHIQGWSQMLVKLNPSNSATTGLAATLFGVVGSVWGFLQARSGVKHKVPTGLVVGLASSLLTFGLLLLVYRLTSWLHFYPMIGGDSGILAFAGATLLVFGWLPEANYVSLHRYYRDRLMELFLPDLNSVGDDTADGPSFGKPWMQPGDSTLLGDLCQPSNNSVSGNKLLRGPYPLINANIVLTASKHPRYRARGGDNYLFSPLHCGSRATGWQPTDRTHGSGFTLATAMAISGAAVNPNAGPGGEGVTRQPVLSVLMGMLNLRLGYWAVNVNHASALKHANPNGSYVPSIPWFKPNQLFPGLAESFGRFFLNEQARFSLLTDGGHFENLGLYELIRRRLKLIIVCDASADPDFTFSDLANAIQKVRADFGAIIDITDEQLATLMPQPQVAADGPSAASAGASRGYLIATIRYSTRVGQNPETGREVGTLILLKATAFKGSPADVFSYRREHPEFPDQSTADQFFDEKQFDSYRELGYITAHRMLKEIESCKAEAEEESEMTKGYKTPTNGQIARLLFGVQGHSAVS